MNDNHEISQIISHAALGKHGAMKIALVTTAVLLVAATFAWRSYQAHSSGPMPVTSLELEQSTAPGGLNATPVVSSQALDSASVKVETPASKNTTSGTNVQTVPTVPPDILRSASASGS